MAFRNYVCWQKDRVYAVMNPDAESVADEVFLAVHSEHPLTLMDPNIANRVGGEAHRWHISPREFMDQFLDPDRNHVQAVIQGESGSGKSHFIKWMALNIPPGDDRYVLTIPKAGMSLRSIVERLIQHLPAEKQEQYKARLERIGHQTVTKEQRRERLMNRIAEAIKADPRRESELSDEEEWLLQELPNIFYDPYLRTILDRRGGVIDELVEHIFEGPQGYHRLESQRLFRPEDLPLEVHDISQMARKAQQVLRYLTQDASMVSLALDIINRNLNNAIAQVLEFTGDELTQLMLEIRRYLRTNGKQLFLLIEDFARLQGIDGALLQVLIEAGTEANGLCEMRWAMAVTRGYYEQVANTVQTRVHFLVDMDLPTGGENPVLTEEHIISFAARYLNAVRLSEEQLKNWLVEYQNSTPPSGVPNACEACQYRADCHAAFGDVNGVGLYPLTRNAILNMARRKDSRLDQRFNPRVLIKDVMAEVLGNYSKDLEQGAFPPEQLLEVMGGSSLPPRIVDELKIAQPAQHQRYLALLGLWSLTPTDADVLPEAIYEAFSLTPVRLTRATYRVSPGKDDEVKKQKPEFPPTIQRHIEAVQAWGRGETMPQDTAQRLREDIYQMLETYIDWDAAGLERVHFARKTSALFQTRYINFAQQQTNPSAAAYGIRLQIPLRPDDADERRETAIALEGLLRYQAYGHWNYPGGAGDLALLAEYLERWSTHLLKQFRAIRDAESTWDPVRSAVEMLAIGAALGGLPMGSNTPLTQRVNALFDPWSRPEEVATQSSEWKSLYQSIYDRRDTLVQIVRAWTSGTKGGRTGNFLDPCRIVPILLEIERSWVLTEEAPENLSKRPDEYGKLASLNRRISQGLTKAVRVEWQRKKNWVERVRQYLPEGASWKELVKVLEALLLEVRKQGISCHRSVMEALDDSLRTASSIHFDNLVRELDSIVKAEDPLKVLPQLARRETGKAMAVSDRLFKAAEQFLDEAEAAVTSMEADLGEEGAALQRDQERIQRSLDQLLEVLSVLGGNDAGGEG